MGRQVITVGVLFAGLFAVTAVIWPADSAKADPQRPKPFEGQALWIFTKQAGRPEIFLEKPEQKRLGDRWFVVGKNMSSPGGVIWWPVEDIISVEEFATREAMAKVVKIPNMK